MKKYDKDFKMNAIHLYKNSGRSLAGVAQELGIPVATFGGWVKTYHEEGQESFPGKGHIKANEAELVALRKELTQVRQERDILKKVVAIFSGPQGRGTNS